MDYIMESNILDTIDAIDMNSLYAEMDLLDAMVQYEHKIETFNELSESDYIMEGSFSHSKVGIFMRKIWEFIKRLCARISREIISTLQLMNSDNMKNFIVTLASQQVALAAEYGFCLIPNSSGGVQFGFRMIDLDMLYNLYLDMYGVMARMTEKTLKNPSTSFNSKYEREIDNVANKVNTKLNPQILSKLPDSISSIEDVKKWDDAAKESGQMYKLYSHGDFNQKILNIQKLIEKESTFFNQLADRNQDTVDQRLREASNAMNNPDQTTQRDIEYANKIKGCMTTLNGVVDKMVSAVDASLKILLKEMNPKDPNSLYSRKYRAKAEEMKDPSSAVANDYSVYDAAVNAVNNEESNYARKDFVNLHQKQILR